MPDAAVMDLPTLRLIDATLAALAASVRRYWPARVSVAAVGAVAESARRRATMRVSEGVDGALADADLPIERAIVARLLAAAVTA